ncbi:MAG: hypothetical protein ABI165_04530 [Bryobacteraceae bacterium]
MRYELSCAVDSHTYLDEGNHSFERLGKVYTFSAREDGRLNEIAISVNVVNTERFKMRFVPHGFLEEYDAELRDEIVVDFQYLESVLGFVGEVTRIRWDAPRARVITENDQEAKDIVGASLRIERKWRITPNRLLRSDLEAIIDDRRTIQPVQLLQSFFREGKNQLYQFRFINAFYNLFFVIEGLYGRGKSGTKELKAAFRDQPEFRAVAIQSWSALVEQDEELARQALSEMGAEQDGTDDQLISRLIDWIVGTRGSTHHFYWRSSRRQGTPLNQHSYEPIACLAFLLAERAINQKVTFLHNSNRQGV